MVVYKITNIINGKFYFGITMCSLSKRWTEHKCKSKSSKSHLALAMVKYGVDNFIIEKISDCDSEDKMYELEVSLIKQFKTNNPEFGYNNSIGGEISSKGKKISDETRGKLSEYQKYRARKPHSQETKDKIGRANKGNKISEEQKKSVSERFKNKTPWNKGIKQKDYVKK
jgi:group I intron endonuclease